MTQHRTLSSPFRFFLFTKVFPEFNYRHFAIPATLEHDKTSRISFVCEIFRKLNENEDVELIVPPTPTFSYLPAAKSGLSSCYVLEKLCDYI